MGSRSIQPFALLFVVTVGVAAAQNSGSSHAQYFEHYEGSKTCLQCHQKEAESFFHSQHYQWKAASPRIVNAKGKRLGKINTINDFCTSPTGNWIGLVENSRGEAISKGCSNCHPSRGLPPEEKISQAQLENIDCLICHASGYRRDLYPREGGGYEWKPILWKNREGLDSVAKRITQPTRTTCLRCHSASGGGANFKRGDLEYKLADCDRDFDVHMASNGKNMQCLACHRGEDHRVRGGGTDLAGTDMPGKPAGCDNQGCHGPAPHRSLTLNHHAKRVNCTVCHIPSFAKEDPTDMARDWSKPVYNATTDKYTATIRLEKDVRPVYAWYNGFTSAQLPGEPVTKLADGTVGIMVPQGNRQDPKAKIYAFKLHQGRLPVLAEKNWIIPITVEHFFANGKIDPAVKSAAKEIYGVDNAAYSWTGTSRYMGIFHGVAPAIRALQCQDCHGGKGRLGWKKLGYSEDPVDALLRSRSRK